MPATINFEMASMSGAGGRSPASGGTIDPPPTLSLEDMLAKIESDIVPSLRAQLPPDANIRLAGSADRLGNGVPGTSGQLSPLTLVTSGGPGAHRDDQGRQNQEPQQGHGRPHHHLCSPPCCLARRRDRGGTRRPGLSPH